MQLTPKTITKYHRVLTKYGLIKKITKRKTSPGGYMQNIYQLTPLDRGKNILHQGNIYPNIRVNITHSLGEKLPTNINNTNINNTTTKDIVVNFKKIKEKGEEKTKSPGIFSFLKQSLIALHHQIFWGLNRLSP